jgi:uncharacterized protein YqeY
VQFREAGREDLVAKDEAELALVKSYLPEALSDEELEILVKGIIEETGAEGMKDMGKVMGAAKKAAGSRADGARINAVAKSLLSR